MLFWKLTCIMNRKSHTVKHILTGALVNTECSVFVLSIRVWFLIERNFIVDSQWRTVLLTLTIIIKLSTGLQQIIYC